MHTLPNKSDVQEFRAYLDANGYSEEALKARIGTALPPRADNSHRLAYLSREATTQNALVRLFLLGASLDQPIANEALAAAFTELCVSMGLLEIDNGRLRSNVVIVGIEDLLFASDAFRVLDSDAASDFVLPASTHSANYLRHLTMRQPFASMLDLGCGCGIHALFAAAHCKHVVATDISHAAIRYTTFNAWLNGIDNVEAIEGTLFEPVAGQTFDLIVSNPPFVLGPDETFVYRDNQLELDQFCQQLSSEAPDFLNENGCLQMLCETVELDGDSWPERMKRWFGGLNCDVWILHNPPLHPVHYVSQRLSDVSGGSLSEPTSFDRWVDYFESRNVSAIHPAMFVMRRRAGRNWLHLHNFQGNVESDAGDAVYKSIVACDFLERCGDDDALLGATLHFSSATTLEQQFSRQDTSWAPRTSIMRTTHGIPMDAEVDIPILAFLNQIDGKKSLGSVLEEFSQTVGADATKLKSDLLPIVRLFVGRGFLEPAE